MFTLIILSIAVLAGLGIIFGLWLSISALKLAVTPDPKYELILNALPGANCGACGYPGCSGLASAILEGTATASSCPVGGKATAKKISEIIGAYELDIQEMVAIVKCAGGCENASDKFKYTGIEDCRAASLISDGQKACAYACVGLGTCEKLCPFGAIKMGLDMLPIIDFDKCTGCGICVKNCPKQVLELIPRGSMVYVACNSLDKGATVKRVCKVGCIACGICEKQCPYDAIHVKNFLAKVDYSKCIMCGICVEKCPVDCIMNRESGIPIPSSERGKELIAAKKKD